MAKEDINKEVMDKEIEKEQEELFTMDKKEIEEAKTSSFNPFWETKKMKHDQAYKFKVVVEGIAVRQIEDKFAGKDKETKKFKKTSRLILTIEELESGMIYDLASKKDQNEEGKYSSLTLAVRRFYAICQGKIKDKTIILTKTKYTHERWGETDSFNIRIIEPGSDTVS